MNKRRNHLFIHRVRMYLEMEKFIYYARALAQ